MINKIKIIAEIGWNHMGNIQLAEKMIKAATNAGADFCKFQTWSVENLKKGPWDKDGRRQIYEKAQLSFDDHIKLKKICLKYKVGFFTSLFNINDALMLNKINKKIIKIPSHEIHNVSLIKKCLSIFDQVLISTGAAKWTEVERISKINNYKKKAIMMHCVSSYPCEIKNINLPRINALQNISKNVGYSGHYFGIEDAIGAISVGCTYIEKHFTINRKLPGRDNKFALLPDDLQKVAQFRNNFQLMNIDRGLDLQKCEMSTYKDYRGRWSK